jgi:hypothetical protein
VCSRPLSRPNPAMYDDASTRPVVPETVRKGSRHTNEDQDGWGSSTPPPQVDVTSTFIQQRALPLSPRAKLNKVSLFDSQENQSCFNLDESNNNSYNHKLPGRNQGRNISAASVASGSEGENDLHGEDSDNELRYGKPLLFSVHIYFLHFVSFFFLFLGLLFLIVSVIHDKKQKKKEPHLMQHSLHN